MTLQHVEPRADRHAPRHERAHYGHDVFIDTLTAARLCDYVKEESPAGYRRARNAFRMFARRRGLIFIGQPRSLRISKRDVEAELHRRERARHGR